MRLISVIVIALVLVLLSIPTAFAVREITLDHVTGLLNGDSLMAGMEIRFYMRFTNTTGAAVTGSTNGWRLWTHRNGELTSNYDPVNAYDLGVITTIMPGAMYDGGIFIGRHSCDGELVDSVKYAGFKMFGTGIPVGFDEVVMYVVTGHLVEDDTLCIDSSFVYPGAVWLWSSSPDVVPDWDGPHCFHVRACCVGDHGNVNLMGGTDISDLTTLVEYIFPPHYDLLCYGAGNVDGDSSSGVPADISDIVYLVDYLFHGGPAPPPCD